MTRIINGAEYRVKAEHPRRPGTPLRITAADGTLLAEAGQTVEDVPQEYLASMLANGYLERVDGESIEDADPVVEDEV